MKFLIIDNNRDDRERIKESFQKEFYSLQFLEVLNQGDFDEAMASGNFDVVLIDHLLNWTDGLWVLRIIKDRFPYIPVIMVTDSGNEEIAVEGMKSGLNDYVLKRHIQRLPIAVKKCLRKIRLDKGYTKARDHVNASQKRNNTISETTADYTYTFRIEPDGTLFCECATDAFSHITGYTLEEVNGRGDWLSLIHPDDMSTFIQHRDHLFSGQSNISGFRIITKNGEVLWLRDYAQPVWGEAQGRVIHIYGTDQNITEHK